MFVKLILLCIVFSSSEIKTFAQQPNIPAVSEYDIFDEIEADEGTALENYNRSIFNFNTKVYRFLEKPFLLYEELPIEARWLIKSVGENYGTLPGNMAFSLLELDLESFLISFWRFTINSSLGLFGLFDVATALDIRSADKTFDMVLDRYGVPEGYYIILPILGPSTTSAMFNDFIKIGINLGLSSFIFGINAPFSVISSIVGNSTRNTIFGVVTGFSEFYHLTDGAKNIKHTISGLDPYISTKVWYLQLKRGQIQKNRELYKTGRLTLDHPCKSNIDLSDECSNFSFENDEYTLTESEEDIKNNIAF